MDELKPGWRRIRFMDMVESVGATRKARGWSGGEAGVDRYVGLEHLDSNSLKIRRWGSPEDVGANSDLRLFEPGDVIFARRRIEHRKVGAADFRGVASGHALVFRAKPHVVLSEFLPFFMTSDLFMTHVDRLSVGSLSPTVNWKALVEQEVLLPPLEQQRAMHAVVAAWWTNVEATLAVAASSTTLRRAWLKDVGSALLNGETAIAPLAALLAGSPEGGCSAPPRDATTGFWVLGLSALDENGYVPSELKPVDDSAGMQGARLAPGDLLISRSNTRERVGFVGRFPGNDGIVSFPDTMMRLRPRAATTSAEFLELLLQTPAIRGRIQSVAAGTSASMKKINRRNLLEIAVPMVELQRQRLLVETWSALRDAERSANERAESAGAAYRCHLNTVLS